jgi:hypothetical protein
MSNAHQHHLLKGAPRLLGPLSAQIDALFDGCQRKLDVVLL